MTKAELEKLIQEVSVGIDRMTSQLNLLIGKREAYKEMLAKMVELEMNPQGEANADEVESAEEVPPCDEPEVS